MTNATTKIIVPILTLCIYAFFFFNFEGAGIDYWDTYIAAPATFIAGQPCVFTGETGDAAYKYNLRNRLPHDLIDSGSYGIVSKDQRIGPGITFAVAYSMFGMAGFRVLYALLGAMLFLMTYAVGQKLFNPAGALAFALMTAMNPFVIAISRLNANFIALPILMALAGLLLMDNPRFLIAGLVYGALGGIKNEVIVIAPAIALLILAKPKGIRGLVLFGGGALVAIAPYLAWNKFAFGKMLIHASQFSDFAGHRPSFPHEFLGMQFSINGLFNWPFHDHLVRTPHYPFPTYLTLPLSIILCFGVLLTAFILPGLAAQWRKGKIVFFFFFLWLGVWLSLFLFQENWEEPKNTFGALAIPPLALFSVRGIEWFAHNRRRLQAWAIIAAVISVLEVGILAASFARVPVDERWYVRFPKAKSESAQTGCLSDIERREWMFFHTDECESELAEQRWKLTRGNLFPALYYPLTLRKPDIAADWDRRNPEIFDIWDKIYGF